MLYILSGNLHFKAPIQIRLFTKINLRERSVIANHSSALAWKIPWTEEPVRLQSMGSQRVRHDWATSLSLSVNWELRPSVRILIVY